LDRNYASHIFYSADEKKLLNTESNPELQCIHPIEQKLFMDDIFEIDKENPKKVNIVSSLVRTCKQIAGVLMLEHNKTFGRTENKKRLLYKCVPDDKHLPAFLVPYEVKMGFSKVQTNKFVTFKYDKWVDTHPMGILTETLGDVDQLDCFYEYQLYCKSLHISLSEFTKKTTDVLRKKSHDEYIEQIFQNSNYNIEDHRDRYIFTIDPEASTDLDDGFHITNVTENNEQIGWNITVYIANVYFWLETLDLWDSFSKRVSTIYLPDRRRPMIPTILTDTLCSLLEKQDRFALAMKFFVTNDGSLDKSQIEYKNVLINVKKNFRYERSNLLNNIHYQNIFNISNLMDKSIKDSHDVVAHWMVQMNAYTGISMVDKKIGIFRAVVFTDPYKDISELEKIDADEDTCRTIKTWNNTTGKYIAYSETEDLAHELIELKTFKQNNYGKSISRPYIHITSPIRRLVDLLNQIILLNKYNLITKISSNAIEFLSNWMGNLNYINTTMRSIRKIQTDCNVLHKCINNPVYMDMTHKGIVFDKLIKANGMYTYMVYLSNLKLLSRITCPYDLDNYSYHMFKMFMFDDEHSFKKKIRLQIESLEIL
jgi:exoribonuclease R